MSFAALLEQLRRHEDLTREQAADFMGTVMDGQALPSQIGGILMALALKGERPAELVGFARAMRQRAVPLPVDVGDVFDTCGVAVIASSSARAGVWVLSSAPMSFTA